MPNTPSPFWLDRPVLVTGATGLVGGYVVEQLLEKGADVVCLVRDWVPQSHLLQSKNKDRVKVVRGELEDLALIERALGEYEIKTVLHLAAQAIVGIANRNPLSTYESNVRGTWLLLEACRRSPLVSAIVVASSDKAYGDQPVLPYTEEMPLLAKHPYDVSKACTDMIAQSYAHTFNLPVAISRCGNFFGRGDLNWNRIIPGTIRSVIRGERPIIRSDGTLVRDYLSANDGASAYLTLAEALDKNPKLRGEAFNFSYEHPMTVLEIAELVLKLMKSDLKLDIKNEASNEIEKQFLSAAKAKKMLGWVPKETLENGLQKTIAWYQEFLSAKP